MPPFTTTTAEMKNMHMLMCKHSKFFAAIKHTQMRQTPSQRDIYGKYFNKVFLFYWTERNGMEPILGLSLSTGICNQRPVNLHFNRNHDYWKAP